MKQRYRLRLVIDEYPEEPDNIGYDADNAQPWPLGVYDSVRDAMNARNALVMIDPPASGDPKKDKANLDHSMPVKIYEGRPRKL